MILSSYRAFIFILVTCLVDSHASPLRRRILSRKVHPKQRNSVRQWDSNDRTAKEGTCLRWSVPTVDRASQWFSEVRSSYNHDAVGMTNPCLHIAQKYHPNTVVPASAKANSNGDDVEWWPPSLVTKKSSWRVIRYRRRIGVGIATYEAVRDACLDWEFQAKGKGIVQLKSNLEPRSFQRRETRGSYEVVHTSTLGDGDMMSPTDSCRRIGSGRRLATYTETPFKLKWLPPLFVVNPVMVVYDLVDQRATGTTFTSTAYATMKGHWLSGEERMTVAHRDGSGNVDLEILSYSRPAPSLMGRLVWPLIAPFQTNFFESQMNSLSQLAESIPQNETKQTSMQYYNAVRGVRL